MNNTNHKFIPIKEEFSVDLKSDIDNKVIKHLFETTHIKAINTAIACNRPLLLTGSPGVGKSQLARAAAKALNRAYVRYTVDAKTEPRDLLWHFDAVARLADAQIKYEGDNRINLDISQYIRPGPLWWGLNWQSASEQKMAKTPVQLDDGSYQNGVVILIDEIDKAEIDVPNGLLEVLGDGSFHPDGVAKPIRIEGVSPLVVITSNKERSLPEAFIRRCVVHQMIIPTNDQELKDWLIKRGECHCSELAPEILAEAADLLIKDRRAAHSANYSYIPGQAEYLDLLRAVDELKTMEQSPSDLLDLVRDYILHKAEAL